MLLPSQLCSHDMGVSTARRAHRDLVENAIALVNTADAAMEGYVPHKDISLPPNVGEACPTCTQGSAEAAPLYQAGARRNGPLAFFAGNLRRGRVRPTAQRLLANQAGFELIDGVLGTARFDHDHCRFSGLPGVAREGMGC